MELLSPSLNMSNQFQSIHLNDPINISINNTHYSRETTKEIPVRFSTKERIPKERDYIGSYKIPGESLKKRTNPTEELIKKKEEELLRKKELLELYENSGERLIRKKYTETTELKEKQKNGNGQEFNLHEISDVEEYTKEKKDEEITMTVKEDLIKVLDSQVNLLKRMSQDQINQLSQSGNFNLLKKSQKLLFPNGAFGLEEPDVDTHFLAINKNRAQTLKHVQTRHKPEYIPLEELEEAKLNHEKALRDIEDEYYGRKKKTEEELRKEREEKEKLLRQRQLNQMIQRPGYNNDNPLEEKDIIYINKFENYLKNKKDEYNKLGYEEEWNNTRLKSLNANGVVNRTDGLPGDLDIDDYKLYYYDIGENSKLNFERPLLIHPHTGKESAYKKTFRIEPGYENTTGKMYKTQTNEEDNNALYSTNKNQIKNPNNLTINTNNYNNKKKNKKNNNNIKSITENPVQNEIINSKNNSFIKMIFRLLPKNNKGKTLKNRIPLEMKLDEDTIKELGFKDEDDFKDKLIKFPTKEINYMNEEEFTSFLLNKGRDPNQINEEENQNNFQNILIPEENLPGMSTTTFDFLKNPSTKARLNHVNKILKGKKSKSSTNLFNKNKNKKNLRIDEQDFIYYKDRHKHKLNNSYEKNNYTKENNINYQINNNNLHHTYTNNFYNSKNNNNYNFMEKYNKKSDINFTVPEPFNFLKKDYHEKKLTKIQEILEERQKTENEILNHKFRHNSPNKKMFTSPNVQTKTELENKKRKERIQLLNEEIKANMNPFSFYDKDELKYKEKLKQECIPPKFVPFKANPIKWRSQVKVTQGLLDNELARKERNQTRAQELLAKAALPPRMEMHEKHKKLRLEEEKKIEKQNLKNEKEKRLFHAKESPNFKRLQEKFINSLENKKRLANPTVPQPFTFHQPKKKAELCNFLDFENNPKNKNPKKNRTMEKVKKNMLKKPKFEPATTKGLTLLMSTRRKEIEMRKKKEEDIIREDEQRNKKHQEFNDRVKNSEVIIKNKKWKKELKNKIDEAFENKKSEMKKYGEGYKNTLKIINQKVNNRPLMMENVVKKEEVNAMDEK